MRGGFTFVEGVGGEAGLGSSPISAPNSIAVTFIASRVLVAHQVDDELPGAADDVAGVLRIARLAPADAEHQHGRVLAEHVEEGEGRGVDPPVACPRVVTQAIGRGTTVETSSL